VSNTRSTRVIPTAERTTIYRQKRASAGGHERHAYPITDACYALGIGRTSLYKMIGDGRIRTIMIAGRVLVPRTEIERLTGARTMA
jgi:excisionase family DNA binding protein